MSYTPTEWKSGDIVTSEKLNKLETGVASAGDTIFLEVILDPEDSGYEILSPLSAAEVISAFQAGKHIMIKYTLYRETDYSMDFWCFDNNLKYDHGEEGWTLMVSGSLMLMARSTSKHFVVGDQYPTH